MWWPFSRTTTDRTTTELFDRLQVAQDDAVAAGRDLVARVMELERQNRLLREQIEALLKRPWGRVSDAV